MVVSLQSGVGPVAGRSADVAAGTHDVDADGLDAERYLAVGTIDQKPGHVQRHLAAGRADLHRRGLPHDNHGRRVWQFVNRPPVKRSLFTGRSRHFMVGGLFVVAAAGYGPLVVDAELRPQPGRIVLVTLRDGRQLEGELIVLTSRYQVGDVVFDAWEIEELEDLRERREILVRGSRRPSPFRRAAAILV
jgi:hypothetical protein